MKKWKLYLYIVIIIVCSCIILNTAWQHRPKWPKKSVKLAHIYLDASSFPTLLQMLDLVQNQPQGPKLISWQRITDTKPIKKKIKNAKIVKHIPYHLAEYWPELEEALRDFVAYYPNAQFIVHVNKDQNNLVWTVLRIVPRERIKELHLYEESFGHTSYQGSPLYSPEKAQQVLSGFRRPQHFEPNLAFSLISFYPQSVVHVALADMALKNPKAKPLHQAGRIEEVDWTKISQQLTPKQKQDLLELNHITPEILKPFTSNKPTVLYTLTFMFNKHNEDEKQLDVLRQIFSGKSKWFSDTEKYTWMYKEHPWHVKDSYLHDNIVKNWPFMYGLPKQIPLEVFFLTGYMPDKVFGYSSALFFSIPAEKIAFYIRRPGIDPYIPILKKMHKITDEQIVSLEDFHVQS